MSDKPSLESPPSQPSGIPIQPSGTSNQPTLSTDEKKTVTTAAPYQIFQALYKQHSQEIRRLCETLKFDDAQPFPFLEISKDEVLAKFKDFADTSFVLSSPNPTTKYFVWNMVNLNPVITQIFTYPPGRYHRFGQIADAFFEIERMKAKRSDMRLSPLEMWRNVAVRKRLIELTKSSKSPLRNVCFKFMKQCDVFEVSVVKVLLSHYKSERILDPCAGWGDRLTGFLATSTTKRYVGVDINNNLHSSYLQLLETLQPSNKSVKLLFTDFIQVQLTETFDTIFTCPPYYNLEEYSVRETRSLQDWIKQFLIPMTTKCMNVLEDGGHFMLAMNDYSGKQCGYTREAIEAILHEGGELIDVVGHVATRCLKLYPKELAVTPIFIFQKQARIK